jgi:hypothetical protein
VKSEWVRAEADLARSQQKLIQVSVQGTIPPLPFSQIQFAALQAWDGTPDHPEWRRVRSSLRTLCGDGAEPGPQWGSGLLHGDHASCETSRRRGRELRIVKCKFEIDQAAVDALEVLVSECGVTRMRARRRAGKAVKRRLHAAEHGRQRTLRSVTPREFADRHCGLHEITAAVKELVVGRTAFRPRMSGEVHAATFAAVPRSAMRSRL